MEALRIEGLDKQIQGKAVLRGLDLSLPEGSIYGLLGLNGAGKTTLIKTLAGLYAADRGRIQWLGNKVPAGSLALKQQLGYVAETDLLPAWARIRDLLELEQALRPEEWEEAGLTAWMSEESLDLGRQAGSLSKGQRKRLELELLLAARPRLLLMDEPLSGLDPVSRRDLQERLVGYVAEHAATVLMSSHILNDLERLCDRIGILRSGRISLELGMDELKERAVMITWTGKGRAKAPTFAGKILAATFGNGTQHWVVLKKRRRAGRAPAGYHVRHEGLEELGAELLRGLQLTEADHV